MRSISTLATFLLAILFTPAFSRAQALADRVPGDAQIYVGWAGTDSLGSGYDQSHLKAILDASQFRQFIQESVPRLIERLSQQNPDAGRIVSQQLDLFSKLAAHPSAFYFGGMDAANPGSPLPKIALLCDAGADAQTMTDSINRLLAQAPGNPFHCATIASLVVVSNFAFPDHSDSPLSANKAFQASVGSLGSDPVAALYVDAIGLTATATQLIQQFAPPPFQEQWPQVRGAIGLDGLKTIAATAGFDGKNWVGQAMVAAPSPRHGLLALGDSGALSSDLLKLIPQSANVAGAFSFDVGALFTAIDHAVAQFAPEQSRQFHEGREQLNQMLGFDLQHDLLDALGNQWAYYIDPATAGNGVLGVTIVNRPRNPDQLQTSLANLESFTNNMLQEQLENHGPKLTVEIRQLTHSGSTIHYAATPLFSPSWTIKDGTLYIGLFPQIVASAIDRPADAASIQDNPDFQAVMQKLHAPQQYSSFNFVNLPKTIPLTYQSVLMVSQLYLGIGDLFGAQCPPLVLPPLDKVMAEIEPAGSVSWTDDAGFHAKAIEPFPGAQMLGSNLSAGMVGESAFMASIMLPSLNRARGTANRVKSASNLRQIGQAILLYSNDNKGAYPPDLGTLVKTEDITAAVFIAPISGRTPPPNMTPDQAADWVNQESDYVYVGSAMSMRTIDPTAVVCYEKEGLNGRDGINVLFGDGHVEFMNLQAAHQAITRQAINHNP